MINILGSYKNGNFTSTIYEDGTVVRENELDFFEAEFPSNIDFKISNRCDRMCPMCHEMSTPDGDNADLMNLKFIDTLHPYTELAIGGGNVFENPDLIPFLRKLKELNVIANITVNQVHFEDNIEMIFRMSEEKLIYGIGVSLVDPTDKFIRACRYIPNVVIHTINGVLTEDQIKTLSDQGLKILILGYKDFGRGKVYLNDFQDSICNNSMYLYNNLGNILNKFKVVSFDNLAILQLSPKRFLTEEQYNEFYMGDDGSFTMYIDGVKEQFSKNSTAEVRYGILDNIDDMFKVIKENK